MDGVCVKVEINEMIKGADYDQRSLIDDLDLSCWVDAKNLINSANYIQDGVEIEINTDISPIINMVEIRRERNRALDAAIKDDKLGKPWIFLTPQDNIYLDVYVSIKGSNGLASYAWYPVFFVEKFLYDIFLCMNLSVPGSCDFSNAYVFYHDGRKNRLNLSSYNFELGLNERLAENFLSPVVMPIDKVVAWYRKLNIGIKQKAESDIEKAIFSLLHICKNEMDVASIIWIFHSLEAIYKTKVGESMQNLVSRITFLLDLDIKSQKILKNSLRKLYNTRSSFVHGGYEIHHPIQNEVIDRRIEDDFSEIYELGEKGFQLIFLSIQSMINKDWFGLDIIETVTGRAVKI